MYAYDYDCGNRLKHVSYYLKFPKHVKWTSLSNRQKSMVSKRSDEKTHDEKTQYIYMKQATIHKMLE